jgi:2-polyprenyl-6-methoxyphenol hydroxylase-like FAD-dependent oxidoreductase
MRAVLPVGPDRYRSRNAASTRYAACSQETVSVMAGTSTEGPASVGRRDGHAVVIGGSMAGLLAARVLARHFERVTLIERDTFPAEPVFRKGVPQSRHLHVLLGKGRALLDRFFPRLTDEVVAAGAPLLKFGRDALWLTSAGWSERFDTDEPLMLSSSRELLEFTVRKRLFDSGRVQFIEDCDVTGLTATPDRSAVTGVTIQPRAGDNGGRAAGEEIAADLVVDASGRTSHAPRWLESLGYEAPEQTTINSFVGYASRLYRIPDTFAADWRLLFLQPKPPSSARGGGLFPIEGNRWIVTVAGAGRDYPPIDEAGFLEFARSLRTPLLYETIKDAQPLTGIAGYQRTENQRRHYDRLRRRPECFLVTGDAVCAFNPIYGQGMTVAADDAIALHRCLVRAGADLTGLAERFQKTIAKGNNDVWLIATGEDLRYPTTEGATPDRMTRMTHRYMDRVLSVAIRNRSVNRVMNRVFNLQASPYSLFKPSVLVPVLLGRGNEPLAEPPIVSPAPAAGQAVAGAAG